MVPKTVYLNKQYMQKLCFIALTPGPRQNILSNVI